MAVNVQAQPGVFALLLGSGVSRAAGIPTGWEVVQDLVRRVAAASEPGVEPPSTSAEVESWWATHRPGVPLGYSGLLAELGPTQGARQGLMRAYFEPGDEELEQGLKVPTAAHRAIAHLVKGGYIRVIVTTNFDRLIERALEDVGVSPQVISTVGAVAGMLPLQHAPATVIKVNGDYADLGMRNTEAELAGYPKALRKLTMRVFEEYGLIVSGWSADWDTDLVTQVRATRNRRFPLFWDSRSSRGATAGVVLANRRGQRVPAADADELFGGLSERAEVLAKLTEPPLTTAVAVARLKRYLPDPVRRIDLHDLVTEVVGKAAQAAAAAPIRYREGMSFDDLVAAHVAATAPTIELLTTGVTHGETSQRDLWVASLRTLLDVGHSEESDYTPAIRNLRLYPALLVMRAMGMVAISQGDEELLLRLFTEPRQRGRVGETVDSPAVHALHDFVVLDADVIYGMNRWNGQRWTRPQSHLLREELRTIMGGGVSADRYGELSDAYEYRAALAQFLIPGPYAWRPAPGEFLPEWGWSRGAVPAGEKGFFDMLARSPDTGWTALLGDEPQTQLDDFRETMRKM